MGNVEIADAVEALANTLAVLIKVQSEMLQTQQRIAETLAGVASRVGPVMGSPAGRVVAGLLGARK